MDRHHLAARLTLDFDPLLAYAALDDVGTKALWDQVISDAYAVMGYAAPPDPATITDRQAADLPYLLDYYALRTITRRMAAQAYIHTPEITHKWEALFDHAKALLADATAAVEARGYVVTHPSVSPSVGVAGQLTSGIRTGPQWCRPRGARW